MEKPRRIAKIGYVAAIGDPWILNPTTFNVIATKSPTCESFTWIDILSVLDDTDPIEDLVERTWTIPESNRDEFFCVGLALIGPEHAIRLGFREIVAWEEE